MKIAKSQLRQIITEELAALVAEADDKYLGNCHIVPNHALIIMSLLFGQDDLQKSLMIVNTSGWDTDCNSGNVGCILGIKNGLEGLKKGPDYLTPINDTIYCPSAIGGETITDALTESYKIINIARNLEGMDNLKIKEFACVRVINFSKKYFAIPKLFSGCTFVSSFTVRFRLIPPYTYEELKNSSRIVVVLFIASSMCTKLKASSLNDFKKLFL